MQIQCVSYTDTMYFGHSHTYAPSPNFSQLHSSLPQLPTLSIFIFLTQLVQSVLLIYS